MPVCARLRHPQARSLSVACSAVRVPPCQAAALAPVTACRVRRLLLPLAVATANTNEGRTTVRARAHMNAGGSTLLVHRGLLNAGGLALPRASSASSTRGGLLVFGMITVSLLPTALQLFQTKPPAPNTRQRCCPFDPLPHAPIPASRPTSFLAHGADPRGVVPVTTPGTPTRDRRSPGGIGNSEKFSGEKFEFAPLLADT